MKSRKKGQITIFIILGIIILLAIFLFIYFREAITVFKPERVIPPELKPFDQFVGACINDVARDGINLMGANGGFIRFPDEIALNPFASLQVNPLFPEVRTPLWFYNGQRRIPSEDYMKEDLAYYIDQNIDGCLNNLTEFRQIFDIIELEPRKIIVELTDRGVDVILDYPLEIRSKVEEQSTKIMDFRTTVPIRLKTVYTLAKDIMEEELKDQFLESRTIDLLALDNDIPYTDLEFTCTPRIWFIQDIKDKLKRLLEVNMPLIRVEKTSYVDVPDSQPYVQNHYIWEVTDLKYPTTHVSFSYDPDYPLDMYIRPNEGLFLKSDANQGFDIMSFLCMHLWHFTYDIKYPVMVTIKDDAGKNHEDYTFNFGFEVSINHNMPDKSNFGTETFEFEPKARSEEFCAEAPTNILTVHTFENISTNEYGDLHDEINDVNLTYTCIRMKCPIGKTDWEFGGAVSILSTEVPYCVNGVLRGTKDGYDENHIFVTTEAEKTVELYLTPITLKNVSVVRHSVIGSRVDAEELLDDDMTAIINVKRKGFSSFAMFPTEQNDFSEGVLSQLKLLGKWDYSYDLEIWLVDDRTILGGYTLSDWKPSWNDLKGAKEIKFHVAEFPYTEVPETQFGYLSGIEETSKRLPAPELK